MSGEYGVLMATFGVPDRKTANCIASKLKRLFHRVDIKEGNECTEVSATECGILSTNTDNYDEVFESIKLCGDILFGDLYLYFLGEPYHYREIEEDDEEEFGEDDSEFRHMIERYEPDFQ